MKMEKDGDGVV